MRPNTLGSPIAALALLLASSSHAQITEIIDAAGDGAGNTLNNPRGVATDATGNVFVSAFASDNAFKITPGGVVTEIIDSTGDGAGNTLDSAEGIATDAAGNVFVVGTNSHNAFKITPGGVITKVIDSAGDGAGNTLEVPRAVATDAAGNIFVAGTISDNAFKITPGGVITEIIDSTGDGAGNTLSNPRGLATDAAGNVFVTGLNSDNAFKITSGGVITEVIDSTGDGAGNTLDGAPEIATDAAGNVFVTGSISDNAFKITPGGVITEIIDSTGDGAGNTLDSPQRIATDALGNVFVSAPSSDNAFRISPGGVITEIIDSTGDGVGHTLRNPFGIAADAAGNVFVAGQLSSNAFRIARGTCGNGISEPGEDCDDDSGCCSLTCEFEPPGFPCGDGDVCNGDETCDAAGTCEPGRPVACEDSNDCTVNSCDPVDGCATDPEPSGTPCPDVDLCNGHETCDGAGTCQPGTPLDCLDDDLCTQDSCDPIDGCQNPAEPASTCLDTWDKGSLLVRETVAGREKLVAKFLKGPALTQADFGDPLDIDGTGYTACIYDDEGTLVESLEVDRAGLACAGKACWRELGTRGYSYKDRDASSDGIRQIRLVAGDEGKSKILIKAGNNSKKSQLDLPLGIADALSDSTSATVQLFRDDAPVCFSMTLGDIKKQKPDIFKVKK